MEIEYFSSPFSCGESVRFFAFTSIALKDGTLTWSRNGHCPIFVLVSITWQITMRTYIYSLFRRRKVVVGHHRRHNANVGRHPQRGVGRLIADIGPEALEGGGERVLPAFNSIFTRPPAFRAWCLASLRPRRSRRRGDCSDLRVRGGSANPGPSQLRSRAIALAPSGDHAHGNEPMRALCMCCCSAPMVPIDGLPPISPAWQRRYAATPSAPAAAVPAPTIASMTPAHASAPSDLRTETSRGPSRDGMQRPTVLKTWNGLMKPANGIEC